MKQIIPSIRRRSFYHRNTVPECRRRPITSSRASMASSMSSRPRKRHSVESVSTTPIPFSKSISTTCSECASWSQTDLCTYLLSLFHFWSDICSFQNIVIDVIFMLLFIFLDGWGMSSVGQLSWYGKITAILHVEEAALIFFKCKKEGSGLKLKY